MPIRVLLVEDSPVALAVLQNILATAPHLEVVGTASTGLEALAMIPVLDPQVICTDLHMPHMDGLVLTTEVMARFPRPILVLSISVQSDDTQRVFQLLEAGAVDILAKPVTGLKANDEALNQALINKIRVLAGVKVFKRKSPNNPKLEPSARKNKPSATFKPPAPQTTAPQTTKLNSRAPQTTAPQITKLNSRAPQTTAPQITDSNLAGPNLAKQPQWKTFQGLSARGRSVAPASASSVRTKIIGIGASTGGPQALRILLGQLPTKFPPVVCVQHISVGFLPGLINWLQQDCAAKVSIAQAGDRPTPGHIYFSPNQHHLILNEQGQFSYLDKPPVDGHKPSVTVTFSALAKYYGQGAVGVLLTGMGQDGALGLSALRETGAMTFAQDEATSVVFGMPQVAIKMGAVCHVLPIEDIAPSLIQWVKSTQHGSSVPIASRVFSAVPRSSVLHPGQP